MAGLWSQLNGAKPAQSPRPNGVTRRQVPNGRLHRIKTVRRQQGISLRTAARQIGSNLRETRDQEEESTDLRLSDLYRWQSALDVPLLELLVEPDDPLSRPVLDRARLVRLMKTATAILECATAVRVRRLAQNLVDQLIELMPELRDVGPWHSVGHRRSLDEYGRILDRSIADEFFGGESGETAD